MDYYQINGQVKEIPENYDNYDGAKDDFSGDYEYDEDVDDEQDKK